MDHGPLLQADELFKFGGRSLVVKPCIWPLLGVSHAFHPRELLFAEELSFIMEDQNKGMQLLTSLNDYYNGAFYNDCLSEQ